MEKELYLTRKHQPWTKPHTQLWLSFRPQTSVISQEHDVEDCKIDRGDVENKTLKGKQEVYFPTPYSQQPIHVVHTRLITQITDYSSSKFLMDNR